MGTLCGLAVTAVGLASWLSWRSDMKQRQLKREARAASGKPIKKKNESKKPQLSEQDREIAKQMNGLLGAFTQASERQDMQTMMQAGLTIATAAMTVKPAALTYEQRSGAARVIDFFLTIGPQIGGMLPPQIQRMMHQIETRGPEVMYTLLDFDRRGREWEQENRSTDPVAEQRLEAAQKLERIDLARDAFDTLEEMLEEYGSGLPQENVSKGMLFTFAPVVGKWSKFVELGRGLSEAERKELEDTLRNQPESIDVLALLDLVQGGTSVADMAPPKRSVPWRADVRFQLANPKLKTIVVDGGEATAEQRAEAQAAMDKAELSYTMKRTGFLLMPRRSVLSGTSAQGIGGQGANSFFITTSRQLATEPNVRATETLVLERGPNKTYAGELRYTETAPHQPPRVERVYAIDAKITETVSAPPRAMPMMGGMPMAAGPMGMGGMGMGGMMRIPAEKEARLKVTTVCLEHGKKDPHPKVAYKMVPVEQVTQDSRVIEVCRMLGYNKLTQNVAQAAAWHLTDNLSWRELALKNRIESKYTGNVAWFHPQELHLAAMVVAHTNRSEPISESEASRYEGN